MPIYPSQMGLLADTTVVKDRVLSFRFTSAADLIGTPTLTPDGALTVAEGALGLTRVQTVTKTVPAVRSILPVWKSRPIVNVRGTLAIYASTDGGATYPHALVSGQRFLLPASATSLKFALDLGAPTFGDNFDRGDATLNNARTSSTGDEWQGDMTAYSITSTRLGSVAGGLIWLPTTTPTSTYSVSCDYRNSSVTQGIAFRIQDASNFFYMQYNNSTTVLYRRIAGSDASLGTVAGHPTNAVLTNVVTMDSVSGAITIVRNGTTIYNLIDPNLKTAGNCGMFNSGNQNGFYDNMLAVSGTRQELEFFSVYLES